MPDEFDLLHNMKSEAKQAKKEEIIREAEESLEQAKIQEQQREKYLKKLNQDRIELLRAKQGFETEEEKPQQEEEVHYTFKQKVSNFFYHYKVTVIICAFVAVLLGVGIYDIVTRENPDINIVISVPDYKLSLLSEQLGEELEKYCDDYNGDGKVSVYVQYSPFTSDGSDETDIYLQQANQTKLVTTFQSDDMVMIITDEETIDKLGGNDGVFEDMTQIYKDDENATTLGYKLTGTIIPELLSYEDINKDYVISIRTPKDGFGMNYDKFKKNTDEAFELLNKCIKKNAE